ncbi:MAG: hypothetical protein NC041_04960 [Bacteroides sp.]|nr:hypothetical protein [Prevotella sp.]MCM1407307.1 hypothetical protein [Treponema brennaborense]MCM1469797.1 hypothetical protein [Bacteroides sp.]
MNIKRIHAAAALYSLCFCLPFAALPAAKIISPAEGAWANYQSLILDVPADCTAVYSFSGSDPLESGFAYDGPVLIDASGDITLRVATIPDSMDLKSGAAVNEQTVSYSVSLVPADYPFYNDAVSAPYVQIGSGTEFSVPECMTYCIGDDETPYITGCVLRVEDGIPSARFFPIRIRHENADYRVMAMIHAAAADCEQPVPHKTLPFPFSCDDWNSLTFFSDDEYLVSVDGGVWENGVIEKNLDRGFPHTVSWQRVRLENGMVCTDSDIETVVLPQKPQILKVSRSAGTSGALKMYLSDVRFSMRLSDSREDMPFYTECCVDTVAGDEISGDLNFDVFYDGVKQGNLSVPYRVDKKPPRPPVIASDGSTFYARTAVKLDITGNGTVFYAVDASHISGNDFFDLAIEPALFSAADAAKLEYKKFSNMLLELSGSEKDAVFYTVYAYVLDDAGNMSDYAAYPVIVDRHNYFVRKNGAPNAYAGDGSPARPFASLADALPLFNNGEFIRLHVSGDFTDLPPIAISSDCEFVGGGAARLSFADGAGISVLNAKLSVSGCIIEGGYFAENAADSETARSVRENILEESMIRRNLFSVRGGQLKLSDCELVSVVGDTGTVIYAENSDVDAVRTGITVQAKKYAACVTAFNTDALFDAARMTVIAPAAVAVSSVAGSLDLSDSCCTVMADLGRIAEMSRSKYRLCGNIFARCDVSETGTALSETGTLSAVWSDERSVCLENTGNMESGFISAADSNGF